MRTTLRVTSKQIQRLLEADWLADDGPILLNRASSLDELSGSPVLFNARIVMTCMAAENGLKLTQAGNFQRKFVKRMVDEFRWPGFDAERVWYLNKVLNEMDFLPLHFLHVLFDVARIGRKYKGTFRLTRLGGSLVAPENAGALHATLFDATFHDYNLAYLDPRQAEDSFQQQIGLTLYMLAQFGDQPHTAAELLVPCTLPIESVRTDFPIKPESVFEARILQYLEWFGLLETEQRAANDEIFARPLYRKTPLYDRFLSFDPGPAISRAGRCRDKAGCRKCRSSAIRRVPAAGRR